LKILLVEDNERVTQFVIKGLQEAGHTTDHAGNGRDGMFLAASEPYDVIIMDRMLPGDIDGLAIIEVLRKAGKRTPILILSALSEVDDRIRGLRSGGDDYLTKPFAFGELLARLDALHRRAQGVDHEMPLGLGLSLAQAVAKLHGSALELSDLNPGLRVLLTIAADTAAAAPSAPAPPPSDPARVPRIAATSP
jgi:DNA-binding response OmpR family regulator